MNNLNLTKEALPILGLEKSILEEKIIDFGLPKFRASQIWNWVWRHGAKNIWEMKNINFETKKILNSKFSLNRPSISKKLISNDGTVKWLLELSDNSKIETVYIPEEKRGTLCISSQVGCTLNCSFCYTGTQKVVRNLSADEICGQLLLALDELKDWPTTQLNRKITNIVFMGMGEPLFNYDEVKKAIKIFTSNEGIGISKKKITLSTSGIIPFIEKCGNELDVNLAISLHAVNDTLRNVLVPINKKYNLESLIKSIKNYPSLSNSRRITWEYVMLDGVNDNESDAKCLLNLIKDIPSKINLIPFNPWPGSNYKSSSDEQIQKFAKIIMNAGYASPVRYPRGQDILAACGQLRSDTIRKRVSH